jgi:NADP-dependent 3-hydroxy acid dehydrogenase YdfG
MTRSIFITGASSGIGAATARAAAKAGWRVGLFARSEETLAGLADEIGGGAMALPGNVRDLDAVTDTVARFAEAAGGLHAAFANAGKGLDTPGTEEGDPEEWRDLIDINIMGVLYTARAALPHLRKTQGHLVMTGSAAGRRHIPGSIYGATKWFVHGYAGNMAEAMREWGGRCTVIAPGMVDTAFFEERKPDKLQAEDVAAAVLHAIDAPERVGVREIFLMPQH